MTPKENQYLYIDLSGITNGVKLNDQLISDHLKRSVDQLLQTIYYLQIYDIRIDVINGQHVVAIATTRKPGELFRIDQSFANRLKALYQTPCSPLEALALRELSTSNMAVNKYELWFSTFEKGQYFTQYKERVVKDAFKEIFQCDNLKTSIVRLNGTRRFSFSLEQKPVLLTLEHIDLFRMFLNVKINNASVKLNLPNTLDSQNTQQTHGSVVLPHITDHAPVNTELLFSSFNRSNVDLSTLPAQNRKHDSDISEPLTEAQADAFVASFLK